MFYVNDDHRVTESNNLRYLTSLWMVSEFRVLQTPTVAPMTIDALFDMWLVEARSIDSDRVKTLSGIAEHQKIALEANRWSVLEPMVLKVPNLSELSHALDYGLEIPTWVARTPSKDYQAGWIMTRRNQDVKIGEVPKTAGKVAGVLGWPIANNLVNPASPDSPLVFVNMGGGHRPVKIVEKSARAAKSKGYRADGSDEITDELRSVRGRAGGAVTTERKEVSSRENVRKARSAKDERVRERAERIRQLRADHVEPSQIAAIVECSLRTVQRHLREGR